MRKPIKTNFRFFRNFALSTFLQKKMEEKIKMQSNGKKQQFRWKNDLMDDLISCLENFEVVH